MLRVVMGTLGQRLRALRRDVTAVAKTLSGRPMPALVERRAATRAAHGIAPRRMRVAEVIRETPDAVTLVFEDESGSPIAFAPGQFFTLHVPVPSSSRGPSPATGVETLKRAYSVSSSALDPARFSVTVKRVDGGRVSAHLVEHARAGDGYAVLGPSGSFTPAATAEARTLVLVGGGSGITPLMSIARTLLEAEPTARVVLVYGNRAVEDVIFRGALEALVRRHAPRFAVTHVLERPPEGWRGETGLLDEATLARALDGLRVPDAPGVEYFVCGPEPMMQSARACLLARGAPPARIREERFLATHAVGDGPREPHTVTLRLRAGERRVVVPPGKTLLEAALDDGAPVAYSCTVGGCGACRVRLVEGRVSMDEPNCLSPAERAEGYVLACVSRPASACVVEVA